MPEFTANNLKNKTLEELATLGERNDPLSAEGILISNELKQRITSSTPRQKMKRWTKLLAAILIGVVGSLLAAALWYHYGPK